MSGTELTLRPDEVRPGLNDFREFLRPLMEREALGSLVIDLYAGAGVLGIEALSFGARHVTFVDRSVRAIKTLEQRLDDLGLQNHATLLCGDPLRIPDPRSDLSSFGLVLLHPPCGMLVEPSHAERFFARVTEFVRSPLTNDQTRIVARLPGQYRDRLPFFGYDQRYSGDSRMVVVRKYGLAPVL